MALIEIEYGSIASSETLNNNFDFLKGEIETVDAKIYSNSSTLESQIATLNANLLAKMEALDEIGLPIITLSNTLRDNEIWLEGAVVSREHTVNCTLYTGQLMAQVTALLLSNSLILGTEQSMVLLPSVILAQDFLT